MSAVPQPDLLPHRKFVILSLPRSRTAWLARFLSYGKRRCGHDVALDCDSVAGFRAKLAGLDGTVETGAVIAWRAIRANLPDVRLIVLKRPVAEVLESFGRLGMVSDVLTAEMRERAHLLDQCGAQAGVETIIFRDLADPAACNRLFETCLEEPSDFEWWESLADRNIQIDIAARFEKIRRNAAMTEALKRDAVQSLPDLEIGLEPFASIWPEVDALGAAHFEEVDGGIEPNRPYRLDVALMQQLENIGCLKIITARVKGHLAGYCTWNITPDVESAGLLIAQQGAWFVGKDFDRLHLGTKMLKMAITELRKLGVKNIFPHHRLQGRGARLGLLFRRMGAKEIQHTYSLWIGD